LISAISCILKIFQFGVTFSDSSKVCAISGKGFLRGLHLFLFGKSIPPFIVSMFNEK
jgi:hypothetical protein